MSQEGGGPTLVESGGFRIDRERALAKLKDFQLPDPLRFVLPLIRCAVAGGAAAVEIKAGFPEGVPQSGRISVEFDGAPFTKEELADPCSVLFEEARPENGRHRDLATGLLTALRLIEPRQGLVTVSSGEGTARMRVKLWSPLPDAAPSFDASGNSGTIVSLSGSLVGGDAAALRQKLRALLEGALETCPVPVRVEGQEIPRQSRLREEWSVSFDEGGVSGWLCVPEDIGGLSCIAASTHGVAAATVPHFAPVAQVAGWVNDDLLTLNVSQTGVVRNKRLERAMAIASSHAEKLVMKMLKDWGDDLKEAGRLAVSNGLGGFMRDCLDRGSQAGVPGLMAVFHRPAAALLKGSSAPDLAAVRGASRCAAWLLQTCERVPESDRDRTPLSQALWKAPLFHGTGGEPLSIEDVRALSRRLGFLPVSKKASSPAHLPFVVVWLASDRHERVLRLLAPSSWKDMAEAEQYPEFQDRVGPDGVPFRVVYNLARFGYGDLLVREDLPFDQGLVEVGIPSPGPLERAMVFVLEESGPRLLEGTPKLGFAAVVTGLNGGRLSAPRTADACFAAADCAAGLCRRLSAEYRPGDRAPRNQSIMLHLLRFLAWAMEEASFSGRAWRLPESRAWAEGLRLFRTGAGWLDYRELRARFDRGDIFRVRTSWTDLKSSEHEVSILGSVYAKEMFADILPGAGFIDLGGEEKAFLLFRTAPAKACEHKSGLGCLAAADGLGVHLTIDEYASGRRLSLPWGTVTALGPGADAPGLEEALAASPETGLDLAVAVVERFGTAWDQPGTESRRFLLRVLMGLCSPWPGSLQPGSRLFEFLQVLPLFRSGPGCGLTVGEVFTRLSRHDDVSYAPCRPEVSPEMADLLLDALELEAVRMLWPEFAPKLRHVDMPSGAGRTEPEVQEQTTALRSPAVPGVPGPAARPDGAMLFSGRYACEGATAQVWFDASCLDRLRLVVAEPGQERFRIPNPGLPLIGAATFIPSGKGFSQALTDSVLIKLFAAFYADLLRAWPLGPPGDLKHEIAARFVLKLLAMNDPLREPAASFREFAEVLGGMWQLKLFRTLGPDMASMRDLHQASTREGVLSYAVDAAFVPPPPKGSIVPVLREPERILVETLLSQGGKIRLRSCDPDTLPQERLPAKGGRTEAEPSPAPPEFAVLQRILAYTRGTRGAKLLPDKVRWSRAKGGFRACIKDMGTPAETIVLSRDHPLAKATTDSGLDETRKGLYLASIVFTAFNHLSSIVTDEDDARFHEAMAEFLASDGPQSDIFERRGKT